MTDAQPEKPPSNITQKPPVEVKPPNMVGCIVPKQPENGNWKMDKALCIYGRDCDPILHSNMLPPSIRINFHCNSGYRIVGKSSFYCGLDGNWSDTPAVAKICMG